MPRRTIEPTERRKIVLSALSGASPTQISRTSGASRQHVYKLVEEARREAQEELAYWTRVVELLGDRDAP